MGRFDFWKPSSQQVLQKTFTEIYEQNLWQSPESRSGPGSTIAATETLRVMLPQLLTGLGVQTVLDAPCGDRNWISTLDLPIQHYYGCDIVEALTQQSASQANHPVELFWADISTSALPHCDLILCRDALVHFPVDFIIKTLENFHKSGSNYLLMTHFFNVAENHLLQEVGQWYPYNFQEAPFYFPAPLLMIPDGYPGKTLSLWSLQTLPHFKD